RYRRDDARATGRGAEGGGAPDRGDRGLDGAGDHEAASWGRGEQAGPHQEWDSSGPQRGGDGSLRLRYDTLKGRVVTQKEEPTLHSRRSLTLRFDIPISRP